MFTSKLLSQARRVCWKETEFIKQDLLASLLMVNATRLAIVFVL